MKMTVLFVLVIFLPLVLFASGFNVLHQLPGNKLPYDSTRNYRLTERMQYYKDADQWVVSEKLVYYYNSAQTAQIDSLCVYSYDPDSQEYTLFMVYHYQYNASGRITSNIAYFIFPGMGYVPMMRTNCVYDAQNRLIHYYLDMHDFTTGIYNPYYRYHFVYSGLSLTTMYGWMNETDKLATYWKSTLESDAQGRPIVDIEQESADSLSWQNSYRTETTYHPNDTSNATTHVEYISSVLPAGLGLDIYSTPAMRAQDITSEWSGTTWVNDEREVLNWNATNNHLISTQNDSWSGDWMPEYKSNFSYDNNNNVSLIVDEEYTAGIWLEQYKEELIWQNYTAVEDNYSPAVTDLKLSTYPMPFSDQVTIIPLSKNSQEINLKIYNLKGQLVQSFRTFPDQSIVWNGRDSRGKTCASGIYYIKASQAGQNTISKVIKLRGR